MTKQLRDVLADGPDELQVALADQMRDPAFAAAYADEQERLRVSASLAKTRRDASMSQKDVARAMGTTQSAVSELEHGATDPQLSTIQRYARAIGTRLDLGVGSVELRRELGADISQAAVSRTLRLLYRNDVVDPSRLIDEGSGDLAHASLQPRTFRKTVDELTASGWAVQRKSSASHRSNEVSLNEDRAAVIGVSIRTNRVRAVLTNLRLQQISEEVTAKLASTTPNAVVSAITEVVQTLRDACPSEQQLVGIGVELAGHVEGSTGQVLFAPDLERRNVPWNGVPLEASVEAATEIRTVVENDANAAAMFAYLTADDSSDGLTAILISEDGSGVGSGSIQDDRIVHGEDGVSAELGHLPAGGDRKCRCGAIGCLETVSSPRAILERIREINGGLIARDLSEVARLYDDQPVVQDVLREAGEALGRAMSMSFVLLKPRSSILYGPAELTDVTLPSGAAFLDAIQAGLHAGTTFVEKVDVVPRISGLQFGATAAAAVAVKYILNSPLRWAPSMSRSLL